MELEFTQYAVAVVFFAVVGLELATGRFFAKSRPGDVLADAITLLVVPWILLTCVLEASGWLVATLWPGGKGIASDWAPWLRFAVLLLADDLPQYAWHRLCHNVPMLYSLHRAHHAAPYLNTRIVFRNNLLYYVFLPSLWFAGALIYLGFGQVYVVYAAAKMVVVIGAHSSVPWDAPLYRWPVTQPLMWVVERVISTPSTHACHHGLHAADGVTHYKGNYGNFLFLWDVLFGTAKISRGRPETFGIEDMDPRHPVAEVFVPMP